jgi:hypothetical protein
LVADLVKTYGLMSETTPVSAWQQRVDTAAKAVTSATVNTQKVEAQVEVLNQLERDCGTLPAEYAQKRQELHASLVALKLHFQTCNDEYNAAQRDLAKEIDKARQQLGAQDQLKGIDLLASFSPTKVGEARPQPVLPGATAVDPMVIQMLISGQEATAKAMDRLASALESGIGEKSEKWRSLKCWTAPPTQMICLSLSTSSRSRGRCWQTPFALTASAMVIVRPTNT